MSKRPLAPAMAKQTNLWFVRHGEVVQEAIGRFIGITDVGLSELGKHQAQATAEFLQQAPIDAIVCSPRQRSQRTVLPLAEHLDLPIETRDGFAEMHFGDWENLTWDEIVAKDPEYAPKWRENPGPQECPGGMSPDGFAEGVRQALDELLNEFQGRNVVLGAHSGVNRAILGAILERPYTEMFRITQDYGCINALGDVGEGYRQIALVNLVPGPQSQQNYW